MERGEKKKKAQKKEGLMRRMRSEGRRGEKELKKEERKRREKGRKKGSKGK